MQQANRCAAVRGLLMLTSMLHACSRHGSFGVMEQGMSTNDSRQDRGLNARDAHALRQCLCHPPARVQPSCALRHPPAPPHPPCSSATLLLLCTPPSSSATLLLLPDIALALRVCVFAATARSTRRYWSSWPWRAPTPSTSPRRRGSSSCASQSCRRVWSGFPRAGARHSAPSPRSHASTSAVTPVATSAPLPPPLLPLFGARPQADSIAAYAAGDVALGQRLHAEATALRPAADAARARAQAASARAAALEAEAVRLAEAAGAAAGVAEGLEGSRRRLGQVRLCTCSCHRIRPAAGLRPRRGVETDAPPPAQTPWRFVSSSLHLCGPGWLPHDGSSGRVSARAAPAVQVAAQRHAQVLAEQAEQAEEAAEASRAEAEALEGLAGRYREREAQCLADAEHLARCVCVWDVASVWTPRRGRSPAAGCTRCLAAQRQVEACVCVHPASMERAKARATPGG